MVAGVQLMLLPIYPKTNMNFYQHPQPIRITTVDGQTISLPIL